jgi:hypothetical protein
VLAQAQSELGAPLGGTTSSSSGHHSGSSQASSPRTGNKIGKICEKLNLKLKIRGKKRKKNLNLKNGFVGQHLVKSPAGGQQQQHLMHRTSSVSGYSDGSASVVSSGGSEGPQLQPVTTVSVGGGGAPNASKNNGKYS